MKGSGRNISLTSYDDLFSTKETRQADAREQIQQIPLSELHPFKDHPFRVVDDDRMMETVESVKAYGVLVPAIARPLGDGGYEIVAGHRRKRACELAGLYTMPVIVRDLDDDESVIIMVDSNLQRENILPSERAKAYQMKLEAICIFIITYGRMIEIYMITSVAPIPMATMVNREWGQMGQNYLRSLFALGFQAFLIMVCVGIYAVLVQNISVDSDVSTALWTCIGYTVLLCFTLFKSSSVAKSIFNAH